MKNCTKTSSLITAGGVLDYYYYNKEFCINYTNTAMHERSLRDLYKKIIKIKYDKDL